MEFKEIPTRSFYKKKEDTRAILPPLPDVSDMSDYSSESEAENETHILLADSDGSNIDRNADADQMDDYTIDETDYSTSDSEQGPPDEPEEPVQKKAKKTTNAAKKPTFVWEKEDLNHTLRFQNQNSCFDPEEDIEVKVPMEYFFIFFSFECIEHMVYQTNLYSTQVTAKSINTNNKEMTDFLSILLHMGIVNLPSYYDYWSRNSRISQIADIMSLSRFKILRRFVHFNNNSQSEGSRDRFFKVRPLLDMVREKCKVMQKENEFSIDETMVPYKGTRAGNLRQYIQNKPHKWGYKLFMLAGVSGIIYDFLPYQGAATFEIDNRLTDEEKSFNVGAKVVVNLCKSISNPSNNIVYFDNYFSSIPLFEYLKNNMNIGSLGTLRANRILNCKLETDKNLLKQGRGSCDYRTNGNVIITKWADNKCVLIGSTVHGIAPQGTVKRFDKTERKKVDVSCPSIILQYNKHMGGVDKSNALVGLYRTPSKAKRWYFPLFTYMLDLAVTNGWLVYKRDCNATGEKPMALKEFRGRICTGLRQAGKPKKGRPSSSENIPTIFKPIAPRPTVEIRTDSVAHWPIHTGKGRCRHCLKGFSRIMCQKCDVRLCLTGERNCFLNFHS